MSIEGCPASHGTQSPEADDFRVSLIRNATTPNDDGTQTSLLAIRLPLAGRRCKRHTLIWRVLRTGSLPNKDHMLNFFRQQSKSMRSDVLSGLTVALALVPEAIAFSFVAGVLPVIGLYSAFFIGLISAVAGGRPGMISGATGAMAVVIVALVATHGVEYLFPTVILCGLLQICLLYTSPSPRDQRGSRMPSSA